MRRRPDRLREVADVEAPGLERLLLEHRERRHPGGERADRDGESSARGRSRLAMLVRSAPASVRRGRPRSRVPRTSRGRRRRSRSASTGSAARRRTAAASASGSPGGTRSASRPSVEQLARGGRVGGHERRRAGERLERLVRDHAGRLGVGPEDAERAARGLDLARAVLVVDPRDPLDVWRAVVEELLELAAADDAKRDLGREARPRRGSSRAREAGSACRRTARGTGVSGCQPGRKSRSSAPTKQTSTRPRASPNSLAEERGVRLGVGDDEIGAPKRPPVDEVDDAGTRRAAPEAATVVDERVEERDERVEDDGPPPATRFAAGRSKWPGIADDQGVGVALGVARAAQAPLRLGDPQHLPQARPTSCGAAPRRRDAARDLDARAAQRRDDLRVPRVVALVRAEVEDAHRGPGLAQHFVDEPRRAVARRPAPRGGS